MLNSLSQIYKKFGLQIIFPAHSRIVKIIGKFGLKLPEGTILNTVKCRDLGKYIKRFFQLWNQQLLNATIQMHDIPQQNLEV